MEEKIIALDRMTDGREYGDLVQCSNCGRVMLVNKGEKICPCCDENGSLMWVDEQQEYNGTEDNLLLVDT